jgi:hypothetical protein
MLHIHMLQAYVLSVFRRFICIFASVSSECWICLQWFSNVFQTFSQPFSDACFCMLQLLYLDVLKVDQILHIGCAWEAANSLGDVLGGASDIWSGAGPLVVYSLASPTR